MSNRGRYLVGTLRNQTVAAAVCFAENIALTELEPLFDEIYGGGEFIIGVTGDGKPAVTALCALPPYRWPSMLENIPYINRALGLQSD